jgi:hypothetical protein
MLPLETEAVPHLKTGDFISFYTAGLVAIFYLRGNSISIKKIKFSTV